MWTHRQRHAFTPTALDDVQADVWVNGGKETVLLRGATKPATTLKVDKAAAYLGQRPVVTTQPGYIPAPLDDVEFADVPQEVLHSAIDENVIDLEDPTFDPSLGSRAAHASLPGASVLVHTSGPTHAMLDISLMPHQRKDKPTTITLGILDCGSVVKDVQLQVAAATSTEDTLNATLVLAVRTLSHYQVFVTSLAPAPPSQSTVAAPSQAEDYVARNKEESASFLEPIARLQATAAPYELIVQRVLQVSSAAPTQPTAMSLNVSRVESTPDDVVSLTLACATRENCFSAYTAMYSIPQSLGHGKVVSLVQPWTIHQAQLPLCSTQRFKEKPKDPFVLSVQACMDMPPWWVKLSAATFIQVASYLPLRLLVAHQSRIYLVCARSPESRHSGVSRESIVGKSDFDCHCVATLDVVPAVSLVSGTTLSVVAPEIATGLQFIGR